MIVILQNNISEKERSNVLKRLEDNGFRVHISEGVQRTIVGVIGVTREFDLRKLKTMKGVADVYRITVPYKLAGRGFQEENTVVEVKGLRIGGPELVIMAGPCSIESEQQIRRLGEVVKEAGTGILRGGAFKPRSSPYSFQGLGEDGLKMMRSVADDLGLVTVTEVMRIDQIDVVGKYADILQIGARNMQNFDLLKEVGLSKIPVVLKRGLSATIEELLMAAEYILAQGNKNVILCERGIRTFEKYTRNTFDISAIPVIKERSHLPIIADPSHATGLRDQVAPMARAAVAAGADGIMVEVHNDPLNAKSDGPQSLFPDQYSELVDKLDLIARAIDREILR